MAVSAIKSNIRKIFLCEKIYYDVVVHVPNFQLSTKSSSFFLHFYGVLFFGHPIRTMDRRVVPLSLFDECLILFYPFVDECPSLESLSPSKMRGEAKEKAAVTISSHPFILPHVIFVHRNEKDVRVLYCSIMTSKPVA